MLAQSLQFVSHNTPTHNREIDNTTPYTYTDQPLSAVSLCKSVDLMKILHIFIFSYESYSGLSVVKESPKSQHHLKVSQYCQAPGS